MTGPIPPETVERFRFEIAPVVVATSTSWNAPQIIAKRVLEIIAAEPALLGPVYDQIRADTIRTVAQGMNCGDDYELLDHYVNNLSDLDDFARADETEAGQ